MRFFSNRLIPEGLTLPKWFETKLYFYPSDLIAPVLILIALFALKIPFRRLFLEKNAPFLWGICFFGALSVAASPLWNYPLLYLRLWQWLTGAFLFVLAANLRDRDKTIRILLLSLIAMASLQSLLAIAQYFHQGSFGLRILGEPNFSRAMSGASAFHVPDGCRWILDRWAGISYDTNVVVRVMGTAAHPNVLGGYLALTSLASLDFFTASKKKWLWSGLIFLQLFALNLTFSRAAIFAFAIGAAIWFAIKRKTSLPAAILLFSSAALIGFLFQEQLFHRGGVVNYNALVSSSDGFRIDQQNLALQMIQKHPFFGVGFQQFSIQAHEFLNNDPKTHVNGAHNIYLMMAAEMGTLALLCFLAFILLSFRRLEPSPFLPSLLAMFIGLLFIGCCDFYPTLFQMGRLLFFLTAGLIAAHGQLRNQLVIEVR